MNSYMCFPPLLFLAMYASKAQEVARAAAVAPACAASIGLFILDELLIGRSDLVQLLVLQ